MAIVCEESKFTGELEDIEFRTLIERYKRQCFHQLVKKSHHLEISYQVIELSRRLQWINLPSSPSDMRINFQVINSQNELLVSEMNREESTFTYEHKEDKEGDYTFCFDNTNSPNDKMVGVEVYVYSADDDDRWGYMIDDEDESTENYNKAAQYVETVEIMKVNIAIINFQLTLCLLNQTGMNKIRDNLIQVVHFQNERQAIERRDRNIIEETYSYVNKFSLLTIFVMMFVSLMQIIVIRNLFEEKNFFTKLLRKF